MTEDEYLQSTAKIFYIAERTGDSSHIDPLGSARQVVVELEQGTLKADGLLTLFVNREAESFDVAFRASRLKCSEMLAALELMKARCVAMMGYIKGPDNP